MMNMERNPAELLRSYGVTPSPQRLAVFNYLLTHKNHPQAETVFRELRPAMPTLSLTTVHNTLKLLVSKKAILEVIIEDGSMRFDGDIRDHAHFKCRKCGQVYDLFPEEGSPLVKEIPALPEGFQLEALHLCMKGVCKSCAAVIE